MKKRNLNLVSLYLGEGMTTQRIVALVDGIYAIAMTLLVLNIALPHQADPLSETAFNHLLFGLWPKFWIFGQSFLLLAIFWSSNHRLFRFIKQANPGLLWINMICLLFVALLPFSTSLVGEYGQLQTADVFFDLNLFVIGAFSFLSWRYAARDHLLDESADAALVSFAKRRSFVFPLISIAAIGLTFISPLWSNLIYILIPFILGGVNKKFRKT